MTEENLSSSKSSSSLENPRIRIFFVILILTIGFSAIASVYLLTRKNSVTRLFPKAFGPKEPTVELKTAYKNPFKKETQYVNPFDQFKSPFYTAP